MLKNAALKIYAATVDDRFNQEEFISARNADEAANLYIKTVLDGKTGVTKSMLEDLLKDHPDSCIRIHEYRTIDIRTLENADHMMKPCFINSTPITCLPAWNRRDVVEPLEHYLITVNTRPPYRIRRMIISARDVDEAANFYIKATLDGHTEATRDDLLSNSALVVNRIKDPEAIGMAEYGILKTILFTDIPNWKSSDISNRNRQKDEELSEIGNVLQGIEITDAVRKTLDKMVEDTFLSDIYKALEQAFQSNDLGVILARLQEEHIFVDLEMINEHDLMRRIQITHDMRKTISDMIDDHFNDNTPHRIKTAIQSDYLGMIFMALQKEQFILDLAWINKSNLLAGRAITNHDLKIIHEIIHAQKKAEAGVINRSGPESQVDSLIHEFGVSGEDIRNTLTACEHVQEPDM